LSAAPAGPAFARTVRLGIVTTPAARSTMRHRFQIWRPALGAPWEVKIVHSVTLAANGILRRSDGRGGHGHRDSARDTFVPRPRGRFPSVRQPRAADAVLDGPLAPKS
jgi:hypothetical protein